MPGCPNCGAPSAGRPRRLVLEAERELEVPLCEPCYRAFAAEEWVETAR